VACRLPGGSLAFRPGWKKDGQKVVQGQLAGKQGRLVKLQTYMNLPGWVLVQYARRPFWSAANDLGAGDFG
jgi:peptidyl-tRNA hydrolase